MRREVAKGSQLTQIGEDADGKLVFVSPTARSIAPSRSPPSRTGARGDPGPGALLRMTEALHPNVRRVVAAGAEVGFEVRPRAFVEHTRTAGDAARAIGVQVAQIVKSLVFLADGSPVVALVGGDRRLDEAKLATAAGASDARRAAAEQVRVSTGYPIGGIPPFGHACPLATFVDHELLAHRELWAAAGTSNVNFAIAPDELVRVTGGLVCDLARR